MTDRERLLKILNVPIYLHENVDPFEAVADYLLDNGVTFAKDTNVPSKWIPVTEHEPEIDCITVDDLGQIVLARRISVITLPTKEKIYLANDTAEEIMSCLGDGDTLINCTHITHWMPLPERPKEVAHDE